MTETLYGRTPQGQLLYDLAFTDMPAKYLAHKHGIPIASIRTMRANENIKLLRRQTATTRRKRRRLK